MNFSCRYPTWQSGSVWARTMPRWPCVSRGGKGMKFIKGTCQTKCDAVNHQPDVYATPPHSTILMQLTKPLAHQGKRQTVFFFVSLFWLCFIHTWKAASFLTEKHTRAGGSNVPFRCRNPPRCIQAWLTLSPWRPSYSAVAVSWLLGRLTFFLLKDFFFFKERERE